MLLVFFDMDLIICVTFNQYLIIIIKHGIIFRQYDFVIIGMGNIHWVVTNFKHINHYHREHSIEGKALANLTGSHTAGSVYGGEDDGYQIDEIAT